MKLRKQRACFSNQRPVRPDVRSALKPPYALKMPYSPTGGRTDTGRHHRDTNPHPASPSSPGRSWCRGCMVCPCPSTLLWIWKLERRLIVHSWFREMKLKPQADDSWVREMTLKPQANDLWDREIGWWVREMTLKPQADDSWVREMTLKPQAVDSWVREMTLKPRQTCCRVRGYRRSLRESVP